MRVSQFFILKNDFKEIKVKLILIFIKSYVYTYNLPCHAISARFNLIISHLHSVKHAILYALIFQTNETASVGLNSLNLRKYLLCAVCSFVEVRPYFKKEGFDNCPFIQ